MAQLPMDTAALIERYGPHLNATPPGGWESVGEPAQHVKTHCCFSGV